MPRIKTNLNVYPLTFNQNYSIRTLCFFKLVLVSDTFACHLLMLLKNAVLHVITYRFDLVKNSCQITHTLTWKNASKILKG